MSIFARWAGGVVANLVMAILASATLWTTSAYADSADTVREALQPAIEAVLAAAEAAHVAEFLAANANVVSHDTAWSAEARDAQRATMHAHSQGHLASNFAVNRAQKERWQAHSRAEEAAYKAAYAKVERLSAYEAVAEAAAATRKAAALAETAYRVMSNAHPISANWSDEARGAATAMQAASTKAEAARKAAYEATAKTEKQR